MQQQYENYHIVFVDDHSSDDNLEKTIEYMRDQLKFPETKIKFIGNKKRKFATYNIVLAAFMYCKPDEIQVLLDGDDELIGTQVFKLLNAGYHASTKPWVVYQAYMSNLYSYGQSKEMNYILNERKIFKGSVSAHRIGPWYVGLIRSIPLNYHHFSNG